MTWMLLDESGNGVGAFDDEVAAHAALRAAPEELSLLEYDDNGNPTGHAVSRDALPLFTVSLLESSAGVDWFIKRATSGCGLGENRPVAASARARAGQTTLA